MYFYVKEALLIIFYKRSHKILLLLLLLLFLTIYLLRLNRQSSNFVFMPFKSLIFLLTIFFFNFYLKIEIDDQTRKKNVVNLIEMRR